MTVTAQPQWSMDTVRFAVEQVRAITDATVDTGSDLDNVERYPMVVVQVAAPNIVHDDLPERAARFNLTLACMSERREVSYSLADQVLRGLIDSWKTGRVTEHGWFSHIRVLTLPTLIPEHIVGDDNWRYDIVLDVTARHNTRTQTLGES